MNKTEQLSLKIEGIHCASCVATIEKGMSKVDGVDECRVNLTLGSATVNFDRARIDQNQIIDQISELGFGAKPGIADIGEQNLAEVNKARKSMKTALAVALPLMAVSMLSMFSPKPILSYAVSGGIQLALASIALLVAGPSILKDAYRQTLRFTANMNSLIAIGTLTAFGWSLYSYIDAFRSGPTDQLYFESVGMIIALILIGRFLESRSKMNAGEAIRALNKLRPDKTLAVINGVEIEIDAAVVKPGMMLIVRPGEKVPADGIVTEGNPVIDESLLTGESFPQEKRVGSEVVGGSLNGNFAFRLNVTKTGEASFLNSVIRMVSDAQSRKAPIQRVADRVAGVFVPIVLGIAVLTLAIWYWLAPDSPMLIKSVVSVLIIACPCALGLATPTAVLAGTGRAAREGIIIRGGDVLEDLNKIDTVVFDKTGTLTRGRLDVVGIRTFGKLSERNLIRIVGSTERQSEHPVGQAIASYMDLQQIESRTVRDVEALPGFGVKAECDGSQVLIGSRALMEENEVDLEAALDESVQEMSKGRTVVFAALDGLLIGSVSLSDVLRSEAPEIIGQLKAADKKVLMISGDNRQTAQGIATLAGVDSFEAEIKPEQKKFIVESYRKSGFNVAMVGDGINDAPALAMANVGVAVGSGAEVAREAAGVVLVRPDLNGVIKMFEISALTLKIIRQNLFWAFFYNFAAIPLAAGLFYPLFGWSLSPVVAAGAMALSSFFVVTNSLRLNRKI
ncbi:MAG: heavy metal translocating P-type ATPase [bacterium]|nr:heavy metal translocating P-type ATPase [bacterium]